MHELLTNREMTRADQLAHARGVSGLVLMENAGRAVADLVCKVAGASQPVVVCAGPGNNGGDGFVTARLLAERGYPVQVLLLGERSRLQGDAAQMAARFTGPIKPPNTAIGSSTLVVDALFGAGLERTLEGPAAQLIEAMNGSGSAIVSVDLPSGIHGDTGAVMGVAVRARQTVTFFREKPGHLMMPGRTHCGAVTLADIGIPETVLADIRPSTFRNVPNAWKSEFPVLRVTDHKYTRGHTVVLSGGISRTGAARLAARAALRAGSGLVTIASPSDALAVNAAASTAVMVREIDSEAGFRELLADSRINAVVLGPGGGVGARMRSLVAISLERKRSVILDADALTSFGDKAKELFTLLSNHPESQAILTPHEGEFTRLFSSVNQIPSVKQKLEAARVASHETRAVVVLKGPDTVVTAPDGRTVIADNAPPALATAGSGDVLAGLIAGLAAQGMPAFEAAAAGVWLHGEASHEVGPGLIAEDLPNALRGVYRRLFLLIDPRSGNHT